MSDGPSRNLSGLDIDLARRIDEVCRRFEAAWREGRQPRIDDYLVDVLDEGRFALRAELNALEVELRQLEETMPRPKAGSAATPESMAAPSPSTLAEVPTIAPGAPLTCPLPGAARTDIHGDVTLLPRDAATVDHSRAESAQPDTTVPSRVRYFGDYEILRELARGGMGVVYQARQINLSRPVALKMILAGQLANETDVKRFYIEAEAAANLDHPGIVPIFEVGQHEGQHYFSMGFVEGQSLSQRLAAGPMPPREAAALLVKVAEAIEYAHQCGVIHRDLKPANILIDAAGNPRVTDFGLAKKIEGDSGLTGSGQIMGTPSYMPPEQAGGKRGDVGPAADVYALGATLYALITGRPPFQAATAMDTVLQLLSDEPVPPRRLNASVPRDLETICLKCLEKEPGKRYPSAAALGEDLRRYLAGEPIVARPVTSLERAVKWARRRPAMAAVLGLVALGLLGLVAFAVVLAGKNRELDARNLELDRQRLQAIDAVKRFHDAVANEPLLKDTPELDELRKRLLKEPLAFFQTLRERLQADRDTRPKSLERLADASHDLGYLTNEIGDKQDAIAALRESLAILQKLVNDHPTVAEYQSNLAGCHNNLGNLLSDTGQPGAARRAYEQALAIQQKMADAHPTVTQYQRDLAESHHNLGRLLSAIGQPEAARRENEQALATWQKLADAHPTVTEYQRALAISHNNLGFLLSATGQPEAARREYEPALAIQQKLADAHPTVNQYQSDLAGSHNNLGLLLSATGEHEAARREHEQALAIQQKLAREHPEAPDYASSLGGILNNMAIIDKAAKRFAEACDELRQAIDWQKKALAANPRNPTYRQYLANHLMNLIDALRGLGRADEAAAAQRERDELIASDPRFAALDARLAAVLKGEAAKDNAERLALARRAHDTKRHGAAAKLWAEAFDADPKLAEDLEAAHRYSAACFAALAAAGQGQDAAKLDDAERTRLRKQGLDWLRADLALRTKQIESANPADRATVQQKMIHWQKDTDLAGIRDKAALAKLPGEEQKACTQLWVDVAALLKKANTPTLATLLEQLPEARKALPKHSPQLAGLLAQIGMGFLEQKKWTEAEPLLRECLAIREKTQPDDWSTFNTQSMLGGSLLGQKKYADAEPLILAGYERMKARQANIPIPGMPLFTDATERVVKLYEAWSKPDEAAEWRTKLAKPSEERKPQP